MGIGRATALILARRGVTVWAVARTEERLEALAAQHERIRPLIGDVSLDDDRARVMDIAGDVDILVNNAGIGSFGMVETMPGEEVRRLFEINVMGLIDLTQRALPAMLRRGRGHVCNVGSTISYLPGPPLSVYAATKFAVEGFSDGLRREVFSRGVGVSLIQPGPVRTAFWDRASAGDRADVRDSGGFGVPAQWVAKAIMRAIRFDRVPGYATVAVPRVLGLGRVLDTPGISFGVDLFAAMARRAPLPMVERGPPQ